MTSAETTTRRGRAFQAVAALAGWATRVRRAAPRPIGWWLDKPQRLTALAWLVALLIVGCARMSVADPIIVGPDMGGGPPTLFERYGVFDHKLLVKPSDEASGWIGIQAGMLHAIGWINSLLLWAFLGLLYGGLTLLEWFLNLSLYEDSALQIDQATRMVADQVFWPLIGATAATGAFLAYAKWRGDGRGFLTDLLWVIAAASLALGFALGPSTLVGELNGARQQLGQGMIAGASQFTQSSNNPVGYEAPQLSGDPQTVATRKLVTGLWNTFGATPWCYAQFRDLDICRQAGHHALANDQTWQKWMDELEDGQTPPVFQDKGSYIRGEDPSRTGVLLMLAALTIPLAYMLVRLIIAGLVAAVGLLLMLVVGLVFLTFWPIEGWFRKVGTQYWLYTLGLLLQAFFITVVIAGIMIVSSIITTQAGRHGFFLIAVLNGALIYAAVKARSWLENLLNVGGAGSSGIAGALITRSVIRTVAKAITGMASGGAGMVAGMFASKTTTKDGWRLGRLASLDYPKRFRGRSGTLDNGPLKAPSARMRSPGSEPQLPGSPAALPSGGAASGSGSAPPAPSPGPSRPSGTGSSPSGGGPAGAGGTGGGGNGGAGTATQPRTTSGSGPVVDGSVTDRQAPSPTQNSQGRRVWAAPPGGRGTAPLDDPSPPSSSSQARSSRLRGWFRRS